MITIFAQKAQLFSKQPSQLITLTHSFLNEAAAFHHPHNKLIPAQYIKQLLSIFQSYSLASTNIDAAYQLLASNSLSVLLRANFGQLAQNKLSGALLLQYTIILQNLSKQIKRQDLPEIFNYLKFAARGVILSKIINKILERTHSFLPQFYRFSRTLLQVIARLISKPQLINLSQQITGKQDLQQVVLRMCFSKKVNLKNVASLLKYLNQQINQLSTICVPASQIQIVNTIKSKYLQIGSNLLTPYKQWLLEVDQQAKQNKNQNIFLEQTIAVRELTPRFYDDEQAFVVNKLRKKKIKLQKKLQTDLRKDVLVRQQEAQILQDVRRQKIDRQHKKELFVVQKQTAQARKFQRSIQKVKKIKKDGKTKDADKGKMRQKGKGRMGDRGKSNQMNKHKLGFKK